MCGISGFNFADRTLVEKMTLAISHRGPDASAVWVGDQISFGHNRLAIIDLSERGAQPMWDSQKEVVIVFNGEIYNYQELRAELETEYTFLSESDTEVIVNAYKKWGRGCVKKFNGIFAFALWDTRTRELIVARDHMGVKPLYYYFENGKFIFSSEIKAILEHDVPRVVDQQAFSIFFELLYIPEPLTMFAGIHKLPAAHYAVFKDTQLTLVKYWEPAVSPDTMTYKEAVKEIRNLFKDSVKRQLISDRPVGIFLSGGLDSTAILGAAAEFHKGQIDTFSVGFVTDVQSEKFNADASLAKKTASYYGTHHHELMIRPLELWTEITSVARHLDEPNFNPTAGAIYLLAKKAKESVAVVLGGDGADELFGGYPRYYYSGLISHYQRLGWFGSVGTRIANMVGAHNFAHKFSLPPNENRVTEFLAQKNKTVKQLLNAQWYQSGSTHEYLKKRYFGNPAPADFEQYFMHIDREGWLVDESLARTDKMTMAHGVEARVPVLDYRLVEIARNIPTAWKFSLWQNPKTFQGKKIWKEAIGSYVPKHVLHQEKRGWFTPMAKWVRNELREPVAEVLAQAKANTKYFVASGIETVWEDHLSGKTYNLNSVWAIVMWQLWYNEFIAPYESK